MNNIILKSGRNTRRGRATKIDIGGGGKKTWRIEMSPMIWFLLWLHRNQQSIYQNLLLCTLFTCDLSSLGYHRLLFGFIFSLSKLVWDCYSCCELLEILNILFSISEVYQSKWKNMLENQQNKIAKPHSAHSLRHMIEGGRSCSTRNACRMSDA